MVNNRLWGVSSLQSDGQTFALPVLTTEVYTVIALDTDFGCDRFGAEHKTGNSFTMWSRDINNDFVTTSFQWFAIAS